jgi:citrate synthase
MDQLDQRGLNNQRSETLSARDAAKRLGVKLETLYAYASRGLLRSVPSERGRGRRYPVADVERLKARTAARSGHGPVAAGALRWGEPVLQTAISSIGSDGPHYRGEPAVELARRGLGFESVAELLWTGTLATDARWKMGDDPEKLTRSYARLPARSAPLPTLLAAVPLLSLADSNRYAAPPEAEWERARRLLRSLAALLGSTLGSDTAGHAYRAGSFAEAVAIGLGASPKKSRAAIDRALILCADHELNASTFAARVVASTGADLYACVTGALAALTGPRHGAASDQVEALLDEVAEPGRAREVIFARMSRGDQIPGFGHPLYPEGDPRVEPMLESACELTRDSTRLATVLAVDAAMRHARRPRPNLDFGLVAIVRALGLKRGAASALFALGRTAGWIAHALEQRDAGFLIRPRAEYVGR